MDPSVIFLLSESKFQGENLIHLVVTLPEFCRRLSYLVVIGPDRIIDFLCGAPHCTEQIVLRKANGVTVALIDEKDLVYLALCFVLHSLIKTIISWYAFLSLPCCQSFCSKVVERRRSQLYINSMQ